MKKKKDGEYLAPQIRVIEIKGQGMICSSGQTQQYKGSTWENPWG